jgi:hypothetical protein
MPECLVDVLNGVGTVLHTFPVESKSSDSVSEEAYLATALKLAAHAHLAPVTMSGPSRPECMSLVVDFWPRTEMIETSWKEQGTA